MFTVTYSGLDLTEHFSVESIQRSILPPREVKLLQIPERHGAYFTGVRYGVREIVLNVILLGNGPTHFMQLMRALAFQLDSDAPDELILSDEPDKKYYAILAENSDIEEILSTGKGQLIFLCPDPYAYAIDEKIITPTNNYFTFVNEGTTTTFPRFTVNFQNNATFVSFISPDGVIMIGNPAQPNQVILPRQELSLWDEMTSMIGWGEAGQVTDYNYTVTTDGVIESVNGGLTPTSYGTGTGWHGPAVRKDLNTSLEDFTVQTRLSFKSINGESNLNGDQIGVVDIYLFGTNGEKIGKLSMYDRNLSYEFTIPELQAGNSQFLTSEPKPPSPHQVTQRVQDSKGNWINETRTVYPTDVGNYNDFDGFLNLSRVGTKWSAEISRYDERGRKYDVLSKFFYDTQDIYPNEALSHIVIHFTRFNDNDPCEVMTVTDLKVLSHNPDTAYDIPALFQAGDTLEVDLQDSSAWLNGEKFLQDIDVGSTFFPIEAGTTEVKVNSNDALATYTATFTERFL